MIRECDQRRPELRPMLPPILLPEGREGALIRELPPLRKPEPEEGDLMLPPLRGVEGVKDPPERLLF